MVTELMVKEERDLFIPVLTEDLQVADTGKIEQVMAQQGMRPADSGMMQAVGTLLEGIGEDSQREGLLDTPKRVAKMLREVTSGYHVDLDAVINGAIFSEDYGESKGSNLSMMGVFFGVGALGMPLLISLLSSWFNYRLIIMGVGFFMLLPLLYILLIDYPKPKQAHEMSLKGIGKLLKTVSLIVLSMILFFQSGWESLLFNWTTTFLIEVKKTAGNHALVSCN